VTPGRGRGAGGEGLIEVLRVARDRGLLGPGALEVHCSHARGFAEVVASLGPVGGLALDLGSGGGVPGLVLATERPDLAHRWILLDGRRRSVTFLEEARARLGLAEVEVLAERAEVAAREPRWRETFSLVVARGFGPPATAAECATGLLAVGGALVVSEPPEGGVDRWPADRLGELGLGPATVHRVDGGHFAVLEKVAACPARFPRRVGVPRKRPWF